MTEPYNNDPVFDPATDADAPVEENTPEEVPTQESTPEPAPTPEPTPEPVPTTVVEPAPYNDSTSVNVNSAPVSAAPTPNDAVSDNPIQPEYADIPVNAKAEPGNAGVTHEATPEQVNENQQ